MVDTKAREVKARRGTEPRRAPRRRLVRSWRTRDKLTGYLFIAPSLLGWLVFVAIPVVAVFWYSLHDFDILRGTFEWIGFENFDRMVDDPEVREVGMNTIIFTVGTVPLRVGLGLALAVLLNRQLAGVRFFRTIYFMPTVVTLVAWAIVWEFLLQGDGGFNGVLSIFGIDGPNYLRESGWAMFWLIIVQVLKGTGVTMILFLAALQVVPQDLKDAARVDGASDWRVFWVVAFPAITPVVLLAFIHATIASLKSFELILLLTGGGPGISTSVLVYYVYVVGFQFWEQGYASAIAVVLFGATLALTLIQFVARKRWVYLEE